MSSVVPLRTEAARAHEKLVLAMKLEALEAERKVLLAKIRQKSCVPALPPAASVVPPLHGQ